MTEVALLVPCYNEAERLKVDIFKRFISQYSSLIDFYFIDDGSSDSTPDLIENQLSNLENCFLYKLSRNLGKGNALRQGFMKINISKYKYIGFIDSDMDIPLEQVLNLYYKLQSGKALLAVSNRRFYNEFNFLRLRSYLSLIMVRIANNLIGYSQFLKDTQCGCKMFHTDIIDYCFREKFVSDWLFDIEVFIRFKKQIANSRDFIIEVPLRTISNNGKSKNKLFSTHKILYQLYKIKRNYS